MLVNLLFYQTDKTYLIQLCKMWQLHMACWIAVWLQKQSFINDYLSESGKIRQISLIVTQHMGPWAITWHCHSPDFYPILQQSYITVRMPSKRKGEFLPPKFMVMACIAFLLSVFLNSSPILSLLPHSEKCNPYKWLVLSVHSNGTLRGYTL